MSIATDSYAAAWRPQDKRPRTEWAHEHVSPPGSARGTRFDVTATPWLREPINFSSDNRVREQVILAPTGAGKTTIFDCIIPHAISEDPGGILFGLQSIPDGKEYVEERLLPILKGAEPVQAILAGMDRHSIRKDCIMFPHMPLYLASGAHLTTLQRRSVRYVFIDEAWRWKHGFLKEARARHHDRWNARVIIVSQGGTTHIVTDAGAVETELEGAWQRTDRREWNYECPECGHVQRFSWKANAFAYIKDERSDGTLDEAAIAQSAGVICQGRCGQKFADTVHVRRTLANSGRYIIGNPTHLAGYHGWHCNALTLYYVSWGQLAVEHAQAHRARKAGDESQIRIWRQKRAAENVREEEQQQNTTLTLGEYKLSDYLRPDEEAHLPPVPWDGEDARFLTIDVQRDHFWAVVRSWKADGSSRRLYVSKITTEAALRDLQTRFGVKDNHVGIDAQFDTDTVYNLCGQYGWQAMHGDKGDSYGFPQQKNIRKFFSPTQSTAGTSGRRCRYFFWSNRQIKRILERFRGGYRQRWEVESDITKEHQDHLFSEIEKDVINKQTKAVERRFVKIGSRQNHTWDCEAMNIVLALAFGKLRDMPDQRGDAPCQLTPTAGEEANGRTLSTLQDPTS